MNTSKKKILILSDWYLPGYKAGGPIKSISTLIANCSDVFDLYVITSDRDLGEDKPYKNIQSDKWNSVGDSVSVYYVSEKNINWKNLLSVIRQIEFDLIYLNSYFSRCFSIYPLLYQKFGFIKTPVLIAPRGMLGDGALQIKQTKKKVFISLSKMLSLHKYVSWHATSKQEAQEIRKVYHSAPIFTASNIPY
ncbi:MAG TPA: glycosyl transferase family 1, partial [Bacteroidia bacterium]